jgi:hypothetical protein
MIRGSRITQKHILCVRLSCKSLSTINIQTVAINAFHGEFMSLDGNNETYQIVLYKDDGYYTEWGTVKWPGS